MASRSLDLWVEYDYEINRSSRINVGQLGKVWSYLCVKAIGRIITLNYLEVLTYIISRVLRYITNSLNFFEFSNKVSVFERNLPNFPEKINLHFWHPLCTSTASPTRPHRLPTIFLPFSNFLIYFCYFHEAFEWITKFFWQFSEYAKNFSEFLEFSKKISRKFQK